MAKVQQKSEKITAFGGIFFVLDKFDSILSSVIDSHLGLRSTLIGYQYSEIIRAKSSQSCCDKVGTKRQKRVKRAKSCSISSGIVLALRLYEAL